MQKQEEKIQEQQEEIQKLQRDMQKMQGYYEHLGSCLMAVARKHMELSDSVNDQFSFAGEEIYRVEEMFGGEIDRVKEVFEEEVVVLGERVEQIKRAMTVSHRTRGEKREREVNQGEERSVKRSNI